RVNPNAPQYSVIHLIPRIPRSIAESKRRNWWILIAKIGTRRVRNDLAGIRQIPVKIGMFMTRAIRPGDECLRIPLVENDVLIAHIIAAVVRSNLPLM